MSSQRTYRGRVCTPEELEDIRDIIREQPRANRAQLSRMVCERLDWRRPDGRLKDMACRVAMLRMHEDGLFKLPPPEHRSGNGKPYQRRTLLAEPQSPFIKPVSELHDLRLEPVDGKEDSYLWNEFIDRYHYLGFQRIPGAQQRYFARSQGKILALLGFGAAAWKTAHRDNFIGWTRQQRKDNLHLIVNNARFLIFPWIRCPNLASKLLSMATRRLADDWQQRYSYRPVLVETFVEQRFQGTCYKAANWQLLGYTQGRGKLETQHKAVLPIKSVWDYPITKKFRHNLCV